MYIVSICFINTYIYTHILVHLSFLIREASFGNRWWLTQRLHNQSVCGKYKTAEWTALKGTPFLKSQKEIITEEKSKII